MKILKQNVYKNMHLNTHFLTPTPSCKSLWKWSVMNLSIDTHGSETDRKKIEPYT